MILQQEQGGSTAGAGWFYSKSRVILQQEQGASTAGAGCFNNSLTLSFLTSSCCNLDPFLTKEIVPILATKLVVGIRSKRN